MTTLKTEVCIYATVLLPTELGFRPMATHRYCVEDQGDNLKG